MNFCRLWLQSTILWHIALIQIMKHEIYTSSLSLKSRIHIIHTFRESQIFVQKFNFDKTPTFSRVFHPNFFLTIFLVKSKLSTAKKSKTTTFSRVFHPQKIDNFLGKSKLNFWTKNEDFVQCVIRVPSLLSSSVIYVVSNISHSLTPKVRYLCDVKS